MAENRFLGPWIYPLGVMRSEVLRLGNGELVLGSEGRRRGDFWFISDGVSI
jgi:hypothetical protein